MKKKFSGTEIVGKLRQADVLIAQSKTVPEVCREIGVTSQTYYRWRNKYGGMSPDMIKQLRELQWNGKGTSYPPCEDKVYDRQTV